MAPLDSTTGKCHHLELPEAEHPQNRLDVRTGSESVLVESKIIVYGGLTIGVELTEVTLKSLNHLALKSVPPDKSLASLVSNQVFSLHLIERKWKRVTPMEDIHAPPARVFPAMVVHDHNLYIFGGLKAEQEGFEPCNDLWRFSLQTGEWELISRCGIARFAHRMIFLKSLSVVEEEFHPGIAIVGGRDGKDQDIHEIEVFDLVDRKWISQHLSLKEVVQPDEKPQDLSDLSPLDDEGLKMDFEELSCNTDTNSIFTMPSNSDSLHDEAVVVYSGNHKEGPLVRFPFVVNCFGGRLTTRNGSPRIVPYNVKWPSAGVFGENLLVIGFEPGEDEISCFLYNAPQTKWSRLNLFCKHQTYTHRLFKGFVWESHHKVVFLGSENDTSTCPSVQHFNLIMLLSLPFTTAIRFNEINNSSAGSKQRDSNVSGGSSGRDSRLSFNAYASYAAPQIKLSSVRSVFPPHAVTLGKYAFSRFGSSLSDLQITSCEGDSVPIPMALCRNRWNRGFDMLLAKGYVRSVEGFETEEGTSMLKEQLEEFQFDDSKPTFKVPFQDLPPTPKKEREREGSVASSVSSSILGSEKLGDESTSFQFTESSSPMLFTSVPPEVPEPDSEVPPVPEQLDSADYNRKTRQLSFLSELRSTDSQMEPLLVPRDLYFPFPTSTVNAFCEFLYSGQVNASWKLYPTAIHMMLIAKYYEVPLLYDLIVEAFYSIISLKEHEILSTIKDMEPSPVFDDFVHYLRKADDEALDIAVMRRASQGSEFDLETHNESGLDTIPEILTDKNKSSFGYSFSESSDRKWPTLKELASADSQPCSTEVVEGIYEASILASDLKLMTRTYNVLCLCKNINAKRNTHERKEQAEEEQDNEKQIREMVRKKSEKKAMDLESLDSPPSQLQRTASQGSLLSRATTFGEFPMKRNIFQKFKDSRTDKKVKEDARMEKKNRDDESVTSESKKKGLFKRWQQ